MLTVGPTTRPRVALYEPSGHGGITHYTFELAEALHQAGWDVTILTAEGYELGALPRQFAVRHVIKASRLKVWLSKLRRSVEQPAEAAALASSAGSQTASASDQSLTTAKQTARTGVLRGLASRIERFVRTLRFAGAGTRAMLWLWVNGTNVVHVQWLVDRTADLYLVRLLRLCGFSVVLTVHDILPHDEFTEKNRRYFRKLYRSVDRLIVHSENTRRGMLELFDIDARNLYVIPHGAQTVFSGHFEVSRTGARQKLGLSDEVRVLLFFGLIKRYKGLEYLLEAFEIVKAQCPETMLLVAGKIYDGDADVQRHYTQLLGTYGDRADVRIDGGYIPLEHVSYYFSAADLVVLPYISASQSGVLLSAYAAGRPVIVTDTGGLGEVVRPGVSGIIVPPKDSAALAEAIITALSDANALGNMGREAKVLAETTYSWSNVAAVTGSMYRSLG